MSLQDKLDAFKADFAGKKAPPHVVAVMQNALSFPILSDHGNAIANEFGLRYRLPDDLIAVYKGFGKDLTIGNGEDSWTLPMPARYLTGTDGVVAYAEINPDYTRRPDPTELLPSLRRLRRDAGPLNGRRRRLELDPF